MPSGIGGARPIQPGRRACTWDSSVVVTPSKPADEQVAADQRVAPPPRQQPVPADHQPRPAAADVRLQRQVPDPEHGTAQTASPSWPLKRLTSS